MDLNPYKPPLANVDKIVEQGAGRGGPPALWNPNAAANWSLLFSPAFGAFLHMKNWQALGHHDKAAKSRFWFILGMVWCACVLVGNIFEFAFPMFRMIERFGGGALLFSWYFFAARAQARYVKESFGSAYPRRGWGLPLLCGFGAFIAVFVIAFALAFIAGFILRAEG